MAAPKKSLRDELWRALPMAAVAIALGITAEFIIAVRPVEPLDVPLPIVDAGALDRIEEADHRIALQVLQDLTTMTDAQGKPQPRSEEARAALSILQGPVDASNKPLAGFGGFFEWNQTAYARPPDDARDALAVFDDETTKLRVAIGEARKVLGNDKLYDWLRRLRAFHADALFYSRDRRSELDKFALGGAPTAELKNLAGGLLELLRREGWLSFDGKQHVPTSILRVRYKLFWTSTMLGLDDCDSASAPECLGVATADGKPSPLALDPAELRAYLDFLLIHPITRPEDGADPESAANVRRLVYLKRLAELDAYADAPTGDAHPYSGNFSIDLTRGAILYRLGDYPGAEQVFRHARNKDTGDMRAWNWHLAALSKLKGDD